jgi:hypothetical protein
MYLIHFYLYISVKLVMRLRRVNNNLKTEKTPAKKTFITLNFFNDAKRIKRLSDLTLHNETLCQSYKIIKLYTVYLTKRQKSLKYKID